MIVDIASLQRRRSFSSFSEPVLAAAYDRGGLLRRREQGSTGVCASCPLGLITVLRSGGSGDPGLWSVRGGGAPDGMANSSVARRLSTALGFFTYLLARGDITVNPVPRGLLTRRKRSRPQDWLLVLLDIPVHSVLVKTASQVGRLSEPPAACCILSTGSLRVTMRCCSKS